MQMIVNIIIIYIYDSISITSTTDIINMLTDVHNYIYK